MAFSIEKIGNICLKLFILHAECEHIDWFKFEKVDILKSQNSTFVRGEYDFSSVWPNFHHSTQLPSLITFYKYIFNRLILIIINSVCLGAERSTTGASKT